MLTKSKIQYIKNLLQKKHRDTEKKFVVEGWKSVDEAVTAGAEIETVLYDLQRVPSKALFNRIERAAEEIFEAKAKEIEAISDTVASQGIVAVVRQFSSSGTFETIFKKQEAVIVLLDGINDPGNMGTIIRTCDWFGVEGIAIGKDSVDLYNPKVVRSTMGSLFHLPIVERIESKQWIVSARKNGFTVYSTELSSSVDIRNVPFSKKSVLIIGSESHGVSPEISVAADKKVLIPRFGKAESLNAAMACGVLLSHIKLSRTAGA